MRAPSCDGIHVTKMPGEGETYCVSGERRKQCEPVHRHILCIMFLVQKGQMIAIFFWDTEIFFWMS